MSKETNKSTQSGESQKSDLGEKNELTDTQLEKVAGGVGGGLWGNGDRNPGGNSGNSNAGGNGNADGSNGGGNGGNSKGKAVDATGPAIAGGAGPAGEDGGGLAGVLVEAAARVEPAPRVHLTAVLCSWVSSRPRVIPISASTTAPQIHRSRVRRRRSLLVISSTSPSSFFS